MGCMAVGLPSPAEGRQRQVLGAAAGWLPSGLQGQHSMRVGPSCHAAACSAPVLHPEEANTDSNSTSRCQRGSPFRGYPAVPS